MLFKVALTMLLLGMVNPIEGKPMGPAAAVFAKKAITAIGTAGAFAALDAGLGSLTTKSNIQQEQPITQAKGGNEGGHNIMIIVVASTSASVIFTFIFLVLVNVCKGYYNWKTAAQSPGSE